jgi:hypothetical protein
MEENNNGGNGQSGFIEQLLDVEELESKITPGNPPIVPLPPTVPG